MITKERAKRAKDKLLDTAQKINDHVARMKAMMQCTFLDQWNGKVVNTRIFLPMARLYGCEGVDEPQRIAGEVFIKNASFGYDYMPAPLTGRSVPQLLLKVCDGWGDFGIPLVCNDNRLDALETRNTWAQIIDLRQEWADKEAEAAKHITKTARLYNKLEESARKIFEPLKGDLGLDTTVLCAFGGDIYDRVNAFRWNEQKKEV